MAAICACVSLVGPLLRAATFTYTYDPLNRLTNAAYAGGSLESYSHDAAGNRLQRVVSVATTISSIGDQTIASGLPSPVISFTVSNPHVSADSLTVTARSANPGLLPKSAFLFGGSGANRTLSITSTSGQTGVTTVSVIVSDGSAAVATEFNVTVLPANRSPIAINDSLQRPAGLEVKVLVAKLIANDSDPDGDPLSLASVGAASTHGGGVSLLGPWVVYTPPAGYDGTDTFTYIVRDGRGGEANGTVTVSLQPPAQAQAITVVDATTLPDGNRRVTFAGIPRLTYSIQASADLTDWTIIGTATASPNGIFYIDDLTATNFPVRFYRTVYP